MTNVQPTIIRRPADSKIQLHSNDLLNRVLIARGLSEADGTELRLNDLLKPDELGGLQQASTLLTDAVNQQHKVTVVGDYDTDGATSTAVAITALRACGAQCVDFLIPNRFDMGYGLGPELAELAFEQGSKLILTVDNGISSLSGVARAKQLGLSVVITDHHLPGEQMPAADAIVNPNLDGDGFGSKNLAGVGVIFYVMLAMCRKLQACNWFDERQLACPNPAEWLDLVALGTVADLVPLDRNNRILVEQGLRRIRAGRARPGINALLQLGKRNISSVVASDLGFAVAPRLNAAGRLDNMQLGVDCLQAPDEATAQRLAAELDQLNLTRREIESDMHTTALGAVEKLQSELDGHVPPVLCLHQSEWHQGVCGIIAGRLKDRYHRPALVFASTEDGSLRGSARSIPGLHIRDAMANIDSSHPGLIEKFGGHAMAAGLSLAAENLDSFRDALLRVVEQHFRHHPPTLELWTDGALAKEHFSLEQAKLLRYAAPWGQGFSEPSFDGAFVVQSQRIVGQRHLKLTLSPVGHDTLFLDAIAFGQPETLDSTHCHAVFRLDINHWRGRDNLQLMIDHITTNAHING